MGKTDDDLIVLLPAARLCLARDLLMGVVQVMQLVEGCHLLSADGPGFVEQGGCASGDDGDVGGFRWGRGIRVGIFGGIGASV